MFGKSIEQRGAAALLTVFLILTIFTIGLLGAVVFVLNERLISRNVAQGLKTYYVAEAGIEEIALRIQPGRTLPSSPHVFAVGDGQARVEIGPLTAGTRALESTGTLKAETKKVSSVLSISTTDVAFRLGAQLGEGGVQMGQDSKIVGNVESAGDVTGLSASKSTIEGGLIVSGFHKVSDITVTGDATAFRFKECAVGGTLSYIDEVADCTAGDLLQISETPNEQPLPIPQSVIDEWKQDAENGGTLAGYSVGNNTTVSLGPKKIEGDLSIGNGSTVNLTGTVWVTGSITAGNGVTIQLDAESYGDLSGVIITDSTFSTDNNPTLRGSGSESSFLVVLSTADTGASAAITVNNGADAAVFYASRGTVSIGNNLELKDVIGYGITIGNNSSVTYDANLSNSSFSSGPGGSWRVTKWREIP